MQVEYVCFVRRLRRLRRLRIKKGIISLTCKCRFNSSVDVLVAVNGYFLILFDGDEDVAATFLHNSNALQVEDIIPIKNMENRKAGKEKHLNEKEN